MFNNNTHDLRKKSNPVATLYWSGCAMVSAAMLSLMPVFGADIFDRLKTMLNNLGTKLTGITTLVAVVMAIICLLIRMFSRSPRSVESATEWLKRIAISWIIINSLQYILNWLTQLTAGGGFSFA